MTEERYSGRAIEALDRQLRDVDDDHRRRLLQVQKAALLARLVRIEEAKSLVTQLRLENKAYEPRLSSWIMYAEGLIAHFDSLDTVSAMGRFRRAHAIAVATGDNELRAICAAWMSDSDFRCANISSSIVHAQDAFRWSNPESHEARGRACLILADLLSWADMTADAKEWYRRARQHAVLLGDIGMQSVILFNSVSFRVAAMVVADCYESTQRERVLALQREVSSVSNLDAGLGIGRLTTLVPALQAELNTVLGNWSVAVAAFSSFLGDIHRDGQDRLSAKYFAQLAWCNSNLGNHERAEVDAQRAIGSVDQCADLDDLAVVYARLSAVYRLSGRDIYASELRENGQRCMSAFVESRESLRTAVVAAIRSISGA